MTTWSQINPVIQDLIARGLYWEHGIFAVGPHSSASPKPTVTFKGRLVYKGNKTVEVIPQ